MLRTLSRWGAIAALVGGTLWVVKFVVITALDGHFQPVESVFFVGGLLAILLGMVGLAATAALRSRSWLKPIAFLFTFAASFVLSFFLLESVQGVLGDTGNEGLDEELGILAVGGLWLAVGFAMHAALSPASPTGPPPGPATARGA